ncbi:YciI family protein [Nostoc sp.]|uniref:YciI family protein n=1 Tax=Nostoc sp. TaxID=1180 RepID=UPI002FF751BE
MGKKQGSCCSKFFPSASLPLNNWRICLLASVQQVNRAYNAASGLRRNVKPLVTEGPFAETHEQLGGFFLIDAQDIDAAIANFPSIYQSKASSIKQIIGFRLLLPDFKQFECLDWLENQQAYFQQWQI